MRKPQSVHTILEKALKSLEIDAPMKSYSMFGAWKEVVGESLATQTQPRSVRNKILFIDVSHSTWMQQLQFLKPTLIEKLNTFLGEPLIQDIRFKIGKISPAASASLAPLGVEDEILDKKALDRIESNLLSVRDRDLKKTLEEVLIKGAKLEQYRKKMKRM